MSELLTVHQAAELLGMTIVSVYKIAGPGMPEDRRLACYRIGPKGGKLRFSRDDCLAYLESCRSVKRVSPTTLVHLDLRPKKVVRRMAP